MEQTALQLMAEKLDAALAIEGDLSLEGLQRIIEQEGGDNALIRALAYGLDHYIDVTNIWNQALEPIPTRPSLVIPQPRELFPLTVVPVTRGTRKRRVALPAIVEAEPAVGQWTWNFD